MAGQPPRIQGSPISGEARRIIARDAALLSRSYRRAFPIVVKRVNGATVQDINGNVYIDFTSGFGTLPVGGGHPRIIEALKDQLERSASYSLTEVYSEEVVDLADELSRIAPIRGDVRILFCNSGSEAVDAAITAMRWHSGRNVILTFIGEHHQAAASFLLSTGERAGAFSARSLGVVYGFGHDCENCFLNLKPDRCEAKCLELSRNLAKEVASEDLAMILFEPIHIRTGVSFPPASYIKSLIRLAKELEGMMVADELITAPARTGRWFALDHWNAKVDAVCLGEQLSSGLPLGVLIAREELLDLEPGMHGSAVRGCQLSVVAALATLHVIKDEGLVERSERIGRKVLKRVHDLVEDLKLSWKVGGIGMLTGIGLLDERGLGNEKLAKTLVDECFRVGLLLRRRRINVLLSPALNIEEELLERGLDIFEEKVRELSQLSRAS